MLSSLGRKGGLCSAGHPPKRKGDVGMGVGRNGAGHLRGPGKVGVGRSQLSKACPWSLGMPPRSVTLHLSGPSTSKRMLSKCMACPAALRCSGVEGPREGTARGQVCWRHLRAPSGERRVASWALKTRRDWNRQALPQLLGVRTSHTQERTSALMAEGL